MVEVEAVERESRRKRTGRMRRGGLWREDMVARREGGMCECVILYEVSQRLIGVQSTMIQKRSFQAIDFPFLCSSFLCCGFYNLIP